MRSQSLGIPAIAAIVLITGWSTAAGASDFVQSNDSAQFMFYFQKSFGGPERDGVISLPTFSLRFEKTVTRFNRDPFRSAVRRNVVPLLSWQIDSAGRQDISALGALRLNLAEDRPSSAGPNWWKWAIGGAAAAAVLCATICRDDNDNVSPGLDSPGL